MLVLDVLGDCVGAADVEEVVPILKKETFPNHDHGRTCIQVYSIALGTYREGYFCE